MAEKKQGNVVEWCAALVPLGRVFDADREIFASEGLLFVDLEGEMVGHYIDEPGLLVSRAGELLAATAADAEQGAPGLPGRIRVASGALGEALRATHPEIEQVVAPTPEIDEVLPSLRAVLRDDHALEVRYFTDDRDADALAAFFRAFAAVYRAAPWDHVAVGWPVSITIPALGLEKRPLLVLGRGRAPKSFTLVENLDDLNRYLDVGPDRLAFEDFGTPLNMPPHLRFGFHGPQAAGRNRVRDIALYGWELADVDDPYPVVDAITEGGEARAVTSDEHAIAEAVALAFVEIVARASGELAAAWKGGAPFERTVTVAPHARGEMAVTLRAPHEDETSRPRRADGPLGQLRDPVVPEGHVDDREVRLAIEDDLVAAFSHSPEAAGLERLEPCRMVMHFAAEPLGVNIATMDADQLEGVLCDILPANMTISAAEASWIVEVSRAFLAFLKRAHALPGADALLAVLDEDAAAALIRDMADGRNLGLAKAVLQRGKPAASRWISRGHRALDREDRRPGHERW